MKDGSYTISEVERAYVKVKGASGRDKGPNGKTAAFYDPCRHRLVKEIRRQLNECNHLHGPFRLIVKNVRGKEREIAIASFPDRITHRLVAGRLSEFDQYLHPRAIAYRRGLNVVETIKAIRESRARYSFVTTFDIKDAFPTTPDALIFAALDRLRLPPVQDAYLRGFLTTPRRNWRGLPVGVAFSPDLFNHALKPVDDILAESLPFYRRYSDNIYIGFEEPPDIVTVQSLAQNTLGAIGDYKIHKFRDNDTKKEAVEFLGLAFMPDGELLPACSAVARFQAWASGPVLYRQLKGWVSYYLSVGVKVEIVEMFLRESGIGFVVTPLARCL